MTCDFTGITNLKVISTYLQAIKRTSIPPGAGRCAKQTCEKFSIPVSLRLVEEITKARRCEATTQTRSWAMMSTTPQRKVMLLPTKASKAMIGFM